MSAPMQQMERIMSDLSDAEVLKLTIRIRDLYVADIAATKTKLDPARLRSLNDTIKRLQATF